MIDPATEEQVWVKDYNLEWTASNIFDIRSDVARKVAGALGHALSPEEETQLAERPTESTEALEAYRLGRFHWNKRAESDIRRAIDYFKTAIESDSAFALPYAGLADAYVLMPWYGAGKPDEWFPPARDAADDSTSPMPRMREASRSG